MELYYSFSAFINAILSFLLGFFVLSRNIKGRVNQTFALFSFSIGIWSLFYIMWPLSEDKESALIWFRLLHIGSIFISITFLHFVTAWLGTTKKNRLIIIIGYIISFYFLLNIFSNNFIKDVEQKFSFEYWGVPGYLYHIYLLFFFLYLFYSVFILIKHYRISKGLKRKQIGIITTGTLIAYVGGSTNYFLWYDINIPPYGNIFVSFFVVLTAYAIVRHRFMGMKMVVSRIFNYILLAVFSLLYYCLISFFATFYLGGIYSSKSLMFGFFVAIVFAFIFVKLLAYGQKVSDKIFYKGNNPIKEVDNLILKLGHAEKTSDFFNIISRELFSFLDSEKIGLMISDHNIYCSINYRFKKSIEERIFINNELFEIIEGSNLKNKIIIKNEITGDNKLLNYLEFLNIEILSPLYYEKNIIGYLVFSNKISNEPYTKEEIEYIELMSFKIANILFNVLRIKRLKRKIKKYKNLHASFSNITKDQILTPLTIINNFLKTGSGSKSHEDQQQIISSCLRRNEKIKKVIDNFTVASEIEAGILNFDFKPTDVLSLFNEIVSDEKYKDRIILKQENIDIKNSPFINTNRAYIKKVIVNILENALLYGEGKKVEVVIKKKNNKLIFSIIDYGIGSLEEDRGHIFNKFYRGKEAKRINKNGLGLGLYVAKKIIEKHEGGEILFRSKEGGKGSIFEIYLVVVE